MLDIFFIVSKYVIYKRSWILKICITSSKSQNQINDFQVYWGLSSHLQQAKIISAYLNEEQGLRFTP